MNTYTFTDEWGDHVHTLLSGPPYEPNKPITCQACIRRLDSVMSEWLDTLTKRHELPDGFWNGYTFPWTKE